MLTRATIATATLLAMAGCSDLVGPELAENVPEQGIGLAINLAAAPEVASVRAVVTAADIAQPIVTLLTIADGVARGTLHVPVGSQRKFLLEALDGAGIVRYAGSAIADVVPGTNAPLHIVMTPVEAPGEVPIIGTIGSYAIVLDVSQATLKPGGFMTLSATVRDPTGAVVADAEIGWLSTTAHVASVDGNGRVAGHSAGMTQIWAGFQGIRAIATVLVAP